MEDLAEKRGLQRSDLKALIDSSEYLVSIEGCNASQIIRRNPSYRPPVSIKRGIDKHDLLAAVDPALVFNTELNQPIKDMKWQSVKCPFHEDDNPSFRILLPDGGFNCLGCDERGGNIIDFVMTLHGLSFPKAIKYLAERYTGLSQ